MILVVVRDSFCHCQNAGTNRLVEVWSIHNLNGAIAGELFPTMIVPAPPHEPFRNWHIHPLNTAGGSAVEKEGIVRRHVRKMSNVGSEIDGQDRNCRVKKVTIL